MGVHLRLHRICHTFYEHPAPGCLTHSNTPITIGLRIVSGLSLHSMKASLRQAANVMVWLLQQDLPRQ